jgi:DNA-binding Lrp family transcriptional regulator
MLRLDSEKDDSIDAKSVMDLVSDWVGDKANKAPHFRSLSKGSASPGRPTELTKLAQSANDPDGAKRFLQALDRDLQAKGLYSPGDREQVDFKRNVQGRMYASRFHFRFPRVHTLIETPEALASLISRMSSDPWIMKRVLTNRLTDLAASRISDIFGVGPRDLKDSHLQSLLACGHFGSYLDERLENTGIRTVPDHFEVKPLRKRRKSIEKLYDPKLALVAFLITRDLVSPDLVETYLPEIDLKEFHRYQAKIHREVEATLPDIFKRFEVFWKTLTPSQQKALEGVYMPRDARMTYSEVARSLNITVPALRKRLKGAIAKLYQAYPDLRALKRLRIPSSWRPNPMGDMGLFERIRGKTPSPFKRLNPKTLETLETVKSPTKNKVRTPTPGLSSKILAWEKVQHEPDHNGVGSPRLAYMRAISPQSQTTLSRAENRLKVQARLRYRDETGESVTVAENLRHHRDHLENCSVLGRPGLTFVNQSSPGVAALSETR